MLLSRSNNPVLKVLVIGILIAFSHNASADDSGNITAKKRIHHRKNLVNIGTTTPKTYLVSFSDKEDAPAKQCAALAKSMEGIVHHVYEHAVKGCSLIFPAAQAQMAFTAMNNNPTVQYVELDQAIYLSQEAMAENIFDSSADENVQASTVAPSWGLDRINQCTLPLDDVVAKQNAAGVNVFIVDTGIYAEHQEFANGVIGPEDCHLSVFSSENALTDVIGHGTHVAGTACGAQYGVSSNCTLCSIKVFNATGHGTVEGAITGIDHVVSKCSSGGIRCVVNMSLESQKSDFFNRVVANAVSKGVVMVVAAGNNNTDACSYSPASTTSAITVGSTTRADIKSSFSNWGSCVDVYAPGSTITSAWISSSTGAENKSGTSMATPHVAGIAAAIRSSNPTWTTTQVRDAIVNSAAALPFNLTLATVDDINCSRLPTQPPSRNPSYSPTATFPPSFSTTSSAQPSFNATSTVKPTSTTTHSSQPTFFPSMTNQPTSDPTLTKQPSSAAKNSAQPSLSPTSTIQPSSIAKNSARPSLSPTSTGQPSSIDTNSAQPSFSPTSTGQPSSTDTTSAQPSFFPTSTGQPTSNSTYSVQPTFNPTNISKPSFSPTALPTTCTTGIDVEVKVTTDKFPLETAWTLTSKCSTPESVINSPPYTGPFTNHSTALCLTRCSSYKFTITDSFGDGLCCTWGNGGYEILVDGRSVHSGGVFLGTETRFFDSPTNQPSLRPSFSPSTTNQPSFNPTNSAPPTVNPTSSYQPTFYPTISDEPTFTPTRNPTSSPTPCAGTDVEVRVMTDKFPLETAWTLNHKCEIDAIINSPQYTAPSTMHTTKLCLPSCSAYKFTITDSYGDGLCCGSGEGMYELLVAGRTVHSGGAFYDSETILIYPPTNQPSSRPSSAVTGQPTNSPTNTIQPTFTPTSPIQSTFKPTNKPTSAKPTGTNQPTFRPTSTKPTLMPINFTPTTTSCTVGTNIEVKVLTDNSPLETAWTLSQTCDTSAGTTMRSPKYTAALTMHSTKLCLPTCSSYKFTITDSHGDGICCNKGNGRYAILVEGSIVHSGGEFLRSEIKLFGPAHGDKSLWKWKKLWSLSLIDAKSDKLLP